MKLRRAPPGGGLGTQAGSEAVLPAYVAGLVAAGVFLHDRVLVDLTGHDITQQEALGEEDISVIRGRSATPHHRAD